MKIKSGLILREVAENYIVVAVGEAVKEFNGLINLNSTGAFLWKILEKGAEEEDLVKAILEEYEIDEEYPIYSIYSYGQENCISLEAKVINAGYTLRARKQVGATIGCHVGPGAFGVLFVHK